MGPRSTSAPPQSRADQGCLDPPAPPSSRIPCLYKAVVGHSVHRGADRGGGLHPGPRVAGPGTDLGPAPCLCLAVDRHWHRAVSHAVSASGRPGGGLDCGAGRSGCRGTCGLRKPGPCRRRIACRGGGTRARLKLWGDSHACTARRVAVSDTVRNCTTVRNCNTARAWVTATLAEPSSRVRPGRTVCLLSRISRRARRGFLRVMATRRLFRCGPVRRATNTALDATAVVSPASALMAHSAGPT